MAENEAALRRDKVVKSANHVCTQSLNHDLLDYTPEDWAWFYCGGGKVVIDALKTGAHRCGVHLAIESFAW